MRTESSKQIDSHDFFRTSNGRGLKAQISLEVLSDFADQALEGQLAEQQLSALLVSADFAQSHGSGAKAMGLLHSSGSGASLAGSLQTKQI